MLRQHNARATFFVIGGFVEKSGELAIRRSSGLGSKPETLRKQLSLRLQPSGVFFPSTSSRGQGTGATAAHGC